MLAKIRRRLGLILFGVVLWLLDEPLPLTFCQDCGKYCNSLCRRCIGSLKAQSAAPLNQ